MDYTLDSESEVESGSKVASESDSEEAYDVGPSAPLSEDISPEQEMKYLIFGYLLKDLLRCMSCVQTAPCQR